LFKKSVLIILIAFASTLLSSLAYARTCQSVFAVSSNVAAKTSVISDLYTKLESVEKSKGNVLLIHGLGDTLTH